MSFTDNFKSLEAHKGDKTKEEEDEFEQQRKATIAEALQAKEDGQMKKFGGGQKVGNLKWSLGLLTGMV